MRQRTAFDVVDAPNGTLKAVTSYDADTSGGGVIYVYADKAAQQAAQETHEVVVIDRLTNMGRETVKVTVRAQTPTAFTGTMERGHWLTGLTDAWKQLGATKMGLKPEANRLASALERLNDDLMPRIDDGTFLPRYANLVDGELRPRTADRLIGLYLTDPVDFARQAPELFLKVHKFMDEAMPIIRRVMPDGDQIEGLLIKAVDRFIADRAAQAAKKAAQAAQAATSAQARPVGTSWKEIDACQTEAELEVPRGNTQGDAECDAD